MTLELYPEQIEYMTAIAYARMGLLRQEHIRTGSLCEGLDAGDVEEVYLDLISDPQTQETSCQCPKRRIRQSVSRL